MFGGAEMMAAMSWNRSFLLARHAQLWSTGLKMCCSHEIVRPRLVPVPHLKTVPCRHSTVQQGRAHLAEYKSATSTWYMQCRAVLCGVTVPGWRCHCDDKRPDYIRSVCHFTLASLPIPHLIQPVSQQALPASQSRGCHHCGIPVSLHRYLS